jgi:hypothetical protein
MHLVGLTGKSKWFLERALNNFSPNQHDHTIQET